jgi:chitinase
MSITRKLGLILLAGASFIFPIQSRADLWCTAYYPGYEQSTLPASDIDYGAVTHIVHFALLPGQNGAVDATTNVISQSNITNLLYYAHQAGKKVLICIGGLGSSFEGVTNATYLNNLVSNMVSFMHTNGYDGVDVDWEPVLSSDQTGFTKFVTKLRTALNAISPRPLLTIAMPATSPTTTGPSILSLVQSQFDQINLQTYDFSGPYEGWFTWFDSPIYDSEAEFPNDGGTPPSINGMINLYLTSGFTASKLGIGIHFEGYIWSGGETTTNTDGVSLPRQQWNSSYPPTVSYDVPYKTLVAEYSTNLYYWDTNAQAAYFSISNQGANNQFVSYDDTRACGSKISYARNNGLGGVILFELADDHSSSGPDPLLEAVKQALATPGAMTIQRDGTSNLLSFTSAPLGSYEVEWTTNLVTPVWNSLFVTNETGGGGLKQFTDTIPAGQPVRFYRVQTPPP